MEKSFTFAPIINTHLDNKYFYHLIKLKQDEKDFNDFGCCRCCSNSQCTGLPWW